MAAGDDGPLESSGVEAPNPKAQDASEPIISSAAVDENRKSNLSQRKAYMKSPAAAANKSHDKSGAVDKSEYEDGEYYDSEDSYGDQQDGN